MERGFASLLPQVAASFLSRLSGHSANGSLLQGPRPGLRDAQRDGGREWLEVGARVGGRGKVRERSPQLDALAPAGVLIEMVIAGAGPCLMAVMIKLYYGAARGRWWAAFCRRSPLTDGFSDGVVESGLLGLRAPRTPFPCASHMPQEKQQCQGRQPGRGAGAVRASPLPTAWRGLGLWDGSGLTGPPAPLAPHSPSASPCPLSAGLVGPCGPPGRGGRSPERAQDRAAWLRPQPPDPVQCQSRAKSPRDLLPNLIAAPEPVWCQSQA